MIKLSKIIITLFAAVIAVMPGSATGKEHSVRSIEVAADIGGGVSKQRRIFTTSIVHR